MRVILNNQNDGPYLGWVPYHFINATKKKKKKNFRLQHEIIQLIKKVRNRIEKARNCPSACRYQRVPSGAFLWREGQQSPLGTGGGYREIENCITSLTRRLIRIVWQTVGINSFLDLTSGKNQNLLYQTNIIIDPT